MSTVLDATVVPSAYDTSGNGGRKLVQLSNGWLVAVVKDAANHDIYFKVSKDNGLTFTNLCSVQRSATINDFVIQSKGNQVFFLMSYITSHLFFGSFDATTQQDVDIYSNLTIIESSQSSMGNISLAVNETGTELHAAWASKNISYANSFNLRYAKGTINADRSVTWGVVEQVTKFNTSSSGAVNPTVLSNGGIVAQSANTSAYSIFILDKNFTSFNWINSTYSNWGNYLIYNGGSYNQSSPSAIFVPQSADGLANGRIWVAWHGSDAGEQAWQIRVSYSDDGGTTWSAMQKLTTSGNTQNNHYPSITANRNGSVFIVYGNYHADNLRKITFNGSTWGNPQTVKNLGTTNRYYYPSTLFDLSVDVTEPMFIYGDNTKVGFYGSWTVTEISVAQGDLGEKTNKDNLLTYAITTDGTMSTVTERINGVVIATKTATSEQNLSVGLTQSQWDAVRFGKYTDATGGKNTLTIEMGAKKWTYTFDKRLATDADVLSVVKAVKDSNEVQLPVIKKMLVDKVGGSNGDTFEKIIKNIALGRKSAKGEMTITTTAGVDTVISGLDFKPFAVFAKVGDQTSFVFMDDTSDYYYQYYATTNGYRQQGSSPGAIDSDSYYMTNDGFIVKGLGNSGYTAGKLMKWIAIQ